MSIQEGGRKMIQEVNVKIDKKAIQEHINKQLDDAVQSTLWFVDTERLSILTCMSLRYLEQHVLNDPRFRAIEIRKNKKRWYPADKAYKVLTELTAEW